MSPNGRTLPKPCLLVCAIVGLALGGLLVGYEPMGGDPDRIYRPIKSELGRALREGRLPFWSDRFGLGVPLVAESHVAAFYPPNWVLYGLLDVSTAYRLAMWAQYVALALAVYAYARRLGLTPWGSALGSVAFTFCGFQTIHSSHEWAYHVLPFLPLCLLLADLFVATGRVAWLTALAIAWGTQLTLGHFQLQMYTGVLVLLTGAWRTFADRRPWIRGLGLIVALVWGAAVAAVQLGPTWELAQIVGQTRRSFAELAFYSFPPAHWAELAIPRLFREIHGGPEDAYWFGQQTTGFEACLYVGTIPLIFAIIGLIVRSRALDPWRLIVPASFALATMPRWWPSGYAALLNVPGLGFFRCPARYTVITSFALALLAGLGFDRAIAWRRFWAGFALAVLFGGAAFAWAVHWSLRPEFHASLSDEGLPLRLGLAAGAWGIAFGLVAAWRHGRVAPGVLVIATAIELGWLYYHGTTRWGWSVPLPSASPILTRLTQTPGVGRVGGMLDNLPVRADLTTATPYLGFPLPAPHSLLKALQERRNLASPEAVRWLRRFGVTHTVWDGPVELRGGETAEVGPDEALDRLAYRPSGASGRRTWRVVRVPNPFPPAHVAIRALVAANRTALIENLSRSDAMEEAWYLAVDQPRDGSGARARSANLVRWEGRSGEVEHDGDCDLVVCRTFYPGWTARVDEGEEQPVRPVNGGLQAVRLVGRRTSRVAMTYRPTGLALAAAISIGALVLALGVVGLGALRTSSMGLSRPRAESKLDGQGGTPQSL